MRIVSPPTAALSRPWYSSPTQFLCPHKIKIHTNQKKNLATSSSTPLYGGNQKPLQLQTQHFCPKHTLSVSVECSLNEGAIADSFPPNNQQKLEQSKGLWSKWKANSAEMSSKLAKLGLAAVLAYGLFDAVTYTTFFVLAFLGYEKSTGNNPVANIKALLGIVILMWTGNNVTRPLRVAGAAALAPLIDKGLKKIQEYFKFPNLVHAFALMVSVVAAPCLTVVGLLILSRWGK